MNATYEKVIAASERVAWSLDEVMPKTQKLDFTKQFLPEALVLAGQTAFLTAEERLKLNQIRGNAYAHLFQFVEEYIVANCVQYAHAEIFGEELGLRAMLRFAEEEVKHQQLFKRFQVIFSSDFGTPCAGIPSQEAVAGVILSKSPMAVMTITLHLELMTQQHYVECVQKADDIDPVCRGMLKAHWLEESQHAKLDALTLQKIAATSTAEQKKQAVKDYCDLLDALGGLLAEQAKLDLASLETAMKKTFTEEQRKALLATQQKAYQLTFVTWGATNPTFVDTVNEVFGDDAKAIHEKVAKLT